MKTTNRVRLKGSALAAGRQGHCRDEETVTIYFDWPGDRGRGCGGVYLTRSAFAAITAAAKRLGVGLEKFFELAIEDTIGKSGRAPARFPMLELESAKIQSKALLKLLADNLDYYASNGCQFGSEEDTSMCAGVAELVRVTNVRLEAAYNSVREETKSKREGVAS